MTTDDLKAYLVRLEQGLQEAERNLSEAQARYNMQRGAIAAVQQLLADAERTMEEEHEHIHN